MSAERSCPAHEPPASWRTARGLGQAKSTGAWCGPERAARGHGPVYFACWEGDRSPPIPSS